MKNSNNPKEGRKRETKHRADEQKTGNKMVDLNSTYQ